MLYTIKDLQFINRQVQTGRVDTKGNPIVIQFNNQIATGVAAQDLPLVTGPTFQVIGEEASPGEQPTIVANNQTNQAGVQPATPTPPTAKTVDISTLQ